MAGWRSDLTQRGESGVSALNPAHRILCGAGVAPSVVGRLGPAHARGLANRSGRSGRRGVCACYANWRRGGRPGSPRGRRWQSRRPFVDVRSPSFGVEVRAERLTVCPSRLPSMDSRADPSNRRPPPSLPRDEHVGRSVPARSCELTITCPTCGTLMAPERAHYRCDRCGYRDSCCF